MSQIDKESLSALLDNEADDLELRRVLKACEQDSQLLETWERYSLVQSVLHQPAIPVSSSLSQKIAVQIEAEAAKGGKTPALNRPNWQLGMAKVAIAASVAVVFMFAVQSNLGPSTESVSMPAIAQGAEVGAPETVQETIELQTASQPTNLVATQEVDPAAQQAAQQRLREYIESMTFDEEEPVRSEHIQDSPLFRLVNELQSKP